MGLADFILLSVSSPYLLPNINLNLGIIIAITKAAGFQTPVRSAAGLVFMWVSLQYLLPKNNLNVRTTITITNNFLV